MASIDLQNNNKFSVCTIKFNVEKIARSFQYASSGLFTTFVNGFVSLFVSCCCCCCFFFFFFFFLCVFCFWATFLWNSNIWREFCGKVLHKSQKHLNLSNLGLFLEIPALRLNMFWHFSPAFSDKYQHQKKAVKWQINKELRGSFPLIVYQKTKSVLKQMTI